MKKWIIIIITICIVISLIAFIRTTNLEKVIHSVQSVKYNFVWLLVITGLGYYFGTLSWRYCLGDNYHSVSTSRLFLIRHIGETVGLFNPTSIVGGDAVKAIMLGKYGIEKKRVVVSVVLSRLILIASQLVLFTLTVSALFIQTTGIRYANIHEKLMYLPPLLVKTKSFRLKIAHFLEAVPPLFKQNKKALLCSIFFALMHWVFGALEFYIILKFLGMEVNILQAFFIDLGVVFFKVAGAFIPGQIGVEEYGNKIMLMTIGIPDSEIWISVSILKRARQLVWIAFGIIAYFIIYNKPTPIPKE